MQRRFEATDADLAATNTAMQRGFEATDAEIKALRQDMNNELKAIREVLATLSERLTRVETLLEQVGNQTDAPEEPVTEGE